MMNHKFYFSSLPGLPKKVKWPVQCVKKIHKDVVVYCKSDDAFFSVNSSQLVEFPNSGLTRLCLETLKKKENTRKAFIEDLNWAHSEDSTGDTQEPNLDIQQNGSVTQNTREKANLDIQQDYILVPQEDILNPSQDVIQDTSQTVTQYLSPEDEAQGTSQDTQEKANLDIQQEDKVSQNTLQDYILVPREDILNPPQDVIRDTSQTVTQYLSPEDEAQGTSQDIQEKPNLDIQQEDKVFQNTLQDYILVPQEDILNPPQDVIQDTSQTVTQYLSPEDEALCSSQDTQEKANLDNEQEDKVSQNTLQDYILVPQEDILNQPQDVFRDTSQTVTQYISPEDEVQGTSQDTRKKANLDIQQEDKVNTQEDVSQMILPEVVPQDTCTLQDYILVPPKDVIQDTPPTLNLELTPEDKTLDTCTSTSQDNIPLEPQNVNLDPLPEQNATLTGDEDDIKTPEMYSDQDPDFIPENDDSSDSEINIIPNSDDSDAESVIFPLHTEMLSTRKSVKVLKERNVNVPNQYVDWDTRLDTRFSTGRRLNEDVAMDTGCEEDVEMDSDYETLMPKECDVLESRIFIRKIVKNSTTKLGKKKRSERVYNTTSICPFCQKAQTNFSHHILSKIHQDEPEVLELVNCHGKERKNKIELLRLKGNHQQNLKVVEKRKGEIRLTRRCESVLKLDQYGPCPSCLGWMLKVNIKRHGIKCPAKESFDTFSSSASLQVQSDVILGRIPVEATEALVKEVFVIMQNDDISRLAKSDELIINLGNQWMKKNVGNKIMRKYYTSSIMRLCARLLIELRKISGQNYSLEQFLQAKYFKHFVEASLICSKRSAVDEEDLSSPSNCIKLGYDIKRIASAKLALSIISGDKIKKSEAKEFLTLMNLNWHTEVTKLARELLIRRSMNKNKALPLPSDIKKLTEFLKNALQKFDVEDITYKNFRYASELTLTRLTLYNRRRSHEVQAITLQEYQKRKQGIDDIAVEMMRELTEWEKKLLVSQQVLEIRGKKSRTVPVIIPADVIPVLQYLTSPIIRTRVGIHQSNHYVFGNNGAGVVRCYDAIRHIACGAGLELPNLVKSTNMRKYMATMVQCLDTTESERNWIVRHLGHNMNVHMTHYQQTSDLIERVDIAKLLLIQDTNRVKDFFGKKLEDIQFEEILTCSEDTPAEDIITGDIIPDIFDFEVDKDDITERKSKGKTSTRQKWLSDEEQELQRLFKTNFLTLKCPNNKEVQNAQRKSLLNKGLIHKRSLETIKKKMSNTLLKLKRS